VTERSRLTFCTLPQLGLPHGFRRCLGFIRVPEPVLSEVEGCCLWLEIRTTRTTLMAHQGRRGNSTAARATIVSRVEVFQTPPETRLQECSTTGDAGVNHHRYPHSCHHHHSFVAPHQLERPLNTRDPLLVVILGPTSSGKTALSLELATRLHGEIVNCDSVAIYREFWIGTAKPTPEEQARAPHHLFDAIEPTSYTTAGEFARRARQVLANIRERGALPIVVGGTGLYLRALLEGLFPGPERSEALRERLRSRAREKGPQRLHRILQRLDRYAAEKIHTNDIPKLIRAIEVCLSARRPMSEQWKSGRDSLRGFRILRMGLDPQRARLYERINARVQAMFDAGLVQETKQLLEKYGDAARPLSSIGYKQVVQLIKGELDLQDAIATVQQAHRNYAKRQMTWFRREPDVHWISGFGDQPDVQAQCVGLARKNLCQTETRRPD
jgi:tRNA dimethylallyltransferase